MVILAGEIGKSESKLALFSHEKDSSNSIVIASNFEPRIQTVETKYEVSELQNMIETFLRDNYDDRQEDIYGACFSIAAPINNKTATLADDNRAVTFTEKDFREKLPYQNLPMAFLNDMEAIGYGIFLGNDESILKEIYTPEIPPNPTENKALMLASGGLGAANWVDLDEKKVNLHPFASEWGHGDFATRTEQEKTLLNHLEKRKNHHKDNSPVSREYVLSRRGLQRIYHYLKYDNLHDNPDFELEPNQIVEKALQGDSFCKSALDLFMAIWGAEAGNLALTFKSQGGVYIVTDLPILPAKFKEDTFLEAFFNKEPEKMGFRGFLSEIPIFLIQKPDIGIWGAARYAIKEGFVTKGKFAIMRANQ